MDFVRLQIQRFMSIGEAELELSDRGLVLIQGVNNDDTSAKSNGAGKSTIPDALSWCLYGETARGESGDAIINRTAKKGTMVRAVMVNDAGEVFSVARHRKHSKNKNRLMVHSWPNVEAAIKGDYDAASDLTQGTDKLTQETVSKILGCSVGVFNAAIYSGQERMPNLPGLTDKQLKELVEEAAGVLALQEAYAEARARLSDQMNDFRVAVSKLDTLETMSIRLENDLERAEFDGLTWQNEQIKAIERNEKEVEAAKEQMRLYKRELPMFERDIERIDAKSATLRKQLDDAQKVIDTRRAYDDVVATRRAEVARLKGVLQMLVRDVKTAESIAKSSEERVGQPCGECGKIIEANDLEHVLNAHRASLKEKVARYREKKEAYDASVLKLSEAERERDAFAASAVTDWSAVTAELTDLAKQRADTQRKIDHKTILDDRLAAAKRALAVEQKREDPYFKVIENVKRQRRETVIQLDEALKLKEKLEVEVDLLQQAVEVFGPAGVRAHILDSVTPFLNSRTSHYLNLLADENIKAIWSTIETTAKGEIRERFNIDIQSVTAGNSFGLLSGGEKRKVRLACALALQDLIATRATQPISLFIADEIDDALDSAGLERLMSILDEKARERGTVLVISHRDLADWIREVVWVKKDGGYASISGALTV